MRVAVVTLEEVVDTEGGCCGMDKVYERKVIGVYCAHTDEQMNKVIEELNNNNPGVGYYYTYEYTWCDTLAEVKPTDEMIEKRDQLISEWIPVVKKTKRNRKRKR